MNGCDVHSLKPFLLDAILTWSTMHGFTPILVTSSHKDRQLPPCLQPMANNPLAFKLSDKAISERCITTDCITFNTPFPQSTKWEAVSLPAECWMSLRIVEIGHIFDFAFPEHILAQHNKDHGVWPLGVFSHKSSFSVNGPEEKVSSSSLLGHHAEHPVLRECKRRPALSLVWSDGNPVSPRS